MEGRSFEGGGGNLFYQNGMLEFFVSYQKEEKRTEAAPSLRKMSPRVWAGPLEPQRSCMSSLAQVQERSRDMNPPIGKGSLLQKMHSLAVPPNTKAGETTTQ